MKWLASKSALLPTLLVSLLVIAALFLRFWNFTDTYLFQADQGRDAVIVADIFRKGDLVFIGPVTSIGNMYLGPFYYYFMLLPLLASYPSPLGPGIAVALVSVLTVYLMYRLGKEVIGEKAALIAAFCFAFSVEIVRFSRFSWNPNLTPPVTFILFWATFKAWKKNPWYWLIVAVCFSILIQLHYMTLLSLGGIGIVWLLQLKEILASKQRPKLKKLLLASLGGILIFGMSLMPLVLFDIKHDGLNRKGLTSLLTQSDAFVPSAEKRLSNRVQVLVQDSVIQTKKVLFEHIITRDKTIQSILLVILVLAMLALARRKLDPPIIMFAAFIIPSLLGISLFQSELHTHYIIFLFPIIFMWFGWLLSVGAKYWWGSVLTIIFVLAFLVFNLPIMPFKGDPWGLDEMTNLSRIVVTHLQPNEEYNLILMAYTRDSYGPHYRYLLSAEGHGPQPFENGKEANTLVVINETEVKNVADSPIYEMVVFPVKIPSDVFRIPNGPEISIFRK